MVVQVSDNSQHHSNAAREVLPVFFYTLFSSVGLCYVVQADLKCTIFLPVFRTMLSSQLLMQLKAFLCCCFGVEPKVPCILTRQVP